ncbi:hypothetical protein D9615_005857 [Tricholomella constricta]|uniref:Uncharacterized protein n=1 Tax=Tricholomella constricta TaxID=117010 RepID=A0A8H5M3A3_9AGAR|nr:hypothetical protein D9615_005857 [Tricholomella constricta]
MTTLAIVTVMFIMAVILWILDIVNFITEATRTLIHNPDTPLDVKLADAHHTIFGRLVVTDLFYSYMCLLGDSVIIWRVYAFYGHGKQRWILALPWAMLGGSFISSMLLTYCGARLGAEIVNGSFQKPLFCKGVQTASYSMGFATTTVATVLIAIKTWEYRRTIKPMVNSTNANGVSRVEKVMTLLVESGVLYLLFFLVQVIGNIPGVEAKNASSFAFLVYSYSTSVIVGLYPTIIVVLAHSQHAVLDTAAATQISTWHAAGPALESTTGSWASSQGSRSTKAPDDIELNISSLTKVSDHRSLDHKANLAI